MATSENMTWKEWREGNWDREKISKPSEYIPIDEQLKIQNTMLNDLHKVGPGKIAILKNNKMEWVDVIPSFGIKYEFYDDDKHSEELVFIGQGAGKYFGISQDDYDEITKGWEGTVHAYNNVREIKKYPVISPEQIAKKFDIPVTKLVIEGFHKITEEERKEAMERVLFPETFVPYNHLKNWGNTPLDKEMD
jgi:hypothetical protein